MDILANKKVLVRAAVSAVAGSLMVLSLAACATIMHGSGQDVGISSAPTGASVWIDNSEKGRTPLIFKLTRKDNHIVKIQMDGYQPFEATVTRSVSGWVWGNIVFGGLIGLAVDAISGGIYKLTPEQVSGSLAAAKAVFEKRADGIYVAVVLKPQADWIKIGQLQQ